ncbi:MAG: hypothetical protein ACI9M3_001378 [Bacteroidia bacterium]|jgi:hypothetical protein
MITLRLLAIALIFLNAHFAYRQYKIKNYKSSLINTFSCGFMSAYLLQTFF